MIQGFVLPNPQVLHVEVVSFSTALQLASSKFTCSKWQMWLSAAISIIGHFCIAVSSVYQTGRQAALRRLSHMLLSPPNDPHKQVKAFAPMLQIQNPLAAAYGLMTCCVNAELSHEIHY